MFYSPLLWASPVFYLMAIYVLAAVLPAVFLMGYVYKQDKIEREPPALMIKLVVGGILAALASIVLELLLQSLVNALVDEKNPVYLYLMAFLVVAAVEEGTKFCFLYKSTWRNPNFNYRFDAVVYAVFVSLGFAAFENVGYVFRHGLSIALPRAILSVPGHMGFAVFMGIFYGRAKRFHDSGDDFSCRVNRVMCFFVPVLLHGIYDTCCMMGTNIATLLFVVFMIAMYLIVFRLIRHESRTDGPV